MNNKKVIEDILKLKKERKAVILTHNYQLPEVQEIGDFVGDSLGLSQQAARTDAEVIVFCGVYFMAETACILAPGKKVILPELSSGCPMADMLNASQLRELKKAHPGATVVTYVNSSAEVKAETDYCCTSANAVNIVGKLKEKEIIFVPDKYLGAYVSAKLNKKMIFWDGYCPTHLKITPEAILSKKREYPNAKVLVHPECRPDSCALADEVASTEGFIRYSKAASVKEIIVGTETGMLYRLKKEVAGKVFIPVCEEAVCPNMKKNTLEKLLWSLEDMKNVITVPEDIRIKAKKAIDRMIETA